jgi:restriction system protein
MARKVDAEVSQKIVSETEFEEKSQLTEITLRDLSNRSRDDAKARLLSELRNLSPRAFEHFCEELLRQLGYRNLVVTKRTGDGGIDGFGDFREGAVSIKSAFQAKRWNETPIGRPDLDRLRGAIQGEFDHGVFLTTSRFSRDATEAAYKKGAISIMLLDGEAITELMIDRGIGVVKQPLVLFEVAPEFFEFDEE